MMPLFYQFFLIFKVVLPYLGTADYIFLPSRFEILYQTEKENLVV